MPFIPYNSAGGEAGSLVGTYQYKINQTNGALELWKGEEKIAEQNSDGSWFKTAVSTGVGSLHLGGDTEGGHAHNISSAGQNVIFSNDGYTDTTGEQVSWFPAWQGVSADLSTLYAPTFLKFEDIDNNYLQNGNAQTLAVQCIYTVSTPLNCVLRSITFQAHQTYNEPVIFTITTTAGVKVHETKQPLTVSAGSLFTITLDSLFFARTNDNLVYRVTTENDVNLVVRRGSSNTAQPWRQMSIRGFVDVQIPDLNAGAVSTVLTSNLSANQPVVTNANGKLVANGALTAGRVVTVSANGGFTYAQATETQVNKLTTTFSWNSSGLVPTTSYENTEQVLTPSGWRWGYNNKGPIGSTTWVREFVSLQCDSGAWNAKSVVIGGTIFQWSAAASNTGVLQYKSNSQAAKQATQFYRLANNTFSSDNQLAWPTDWINTLISLGGGYNTAEMTMVTRSTASDATYSGTAWRVWAGSTGSSTLNIIIEYYGPKVS